MTASRVAVAAPNADAVLAATEVALVGGNAVDAAVAAMVVAMVTEPGVVSPLGGGFVAVATPSGEQVVVDGNVEMPGRGAPPERFGTGLREVTTTYGGGLTLSVGHGSVATPGAVVALGEAHARYGVAPWRDVLAPAAAVCRDGYRLGTAAGSYLAITGEEVFGWDVETRAALTRPDGAFVRPGDLVRSPDLGAALDVLAEEGSTSLTTGSLARAVADDMDARGGLVTAADLAAYRPVVRPGLGVRVGGWALSTNPPPAIGGPVLAAMLRLCDDSPGTLRDVVDVQRRVLSYRSTHLDRARDLDAAGRELWELVRDEGVQGLPTSASTAHVSVVGGDGTACSITASSGYGSGATVPGTGLLLNNCLGEPELNRLGVHALAPGTRLASNMAPTTGRSDDGAVLAVGSPGADRITTALLQVLLAFCVGGRPLQDAIDAPRVHVRLDPAVVLEHEEGVGGVASVAAELGLAARAHPVNHMYFGGVGAALLGRDGSLQAAGDPRRAAATGVT